MPETQTPEQPQQSPQQLGLPMNPQDALKILEEATSALQTTRDNHFKIFNSLITFREVIKQRDDYLTMLKPVEPTQTQKKD